MNVFGTFLRSIQSVSVLGAVGAMKFFLSAYSNRTFRIRPKNYRHPLFLRGRSSDRMVLYSIFIENQYPADRGSDPRRIIDAGANVGYASVFFAHHYPNAEIIALEPEKNNFRMLERNTGCYQNIRRVKGALWKERTTLSMANPQAPSWAFQLTDKLERKGESVNAYTVQDLMADAKWTTVDLMKIDIEGAEREVFLRNTDWLQNTRCLYIEVHDEQEPGAAHAVFAALQQFRYQLKFSGDCLLMRIDGVDPEARR
jgi:FkbM family methyltransferase